MMVDSAIITVLDRTNEFIGDFDLPVKITIKELCLKIADTLKAMDSEKYMRIDNVALEYNGGILKGDDTLYQNSIWDGATIKLIY